MDDVDLMAVINAAREVFSGTGIFLACVYGSRVRGTARRDSDLDIGYYLGEEGGEGGRLSIRDEMVLADRMSRSLGVAVDLRNLRTAPLELRGRVLEEGERIFCSDERARVSLESALLSRYHDYKPTYAAMHEARLAALARSR